MDRNKLEYFKKKLLREKNRVMDTLERMNANEPNASLKDYYDELSSYDNHPADLGTETFMTEQNMNLKNVEKLRLREIETSIDKIQEGNYGFCDICGKEINEERLNMIPESKICLDCAHKKIPIDDLMNYRPKEEENLEVPFARTFKDDADDEQVGFDGEDSWQAVARYNEVKGDPSFVTGDHIGYFDSVEHGIVEEVDKISNEYYKELTHGINKKDVARKERSDYNNNLEN